MKKLFAIAVVILFTSFTMINKDEPGFLVTQIKKNYVKIKDDLFVSKYEVSNAEYRSFLAGLLNGGRHEIYESCLPDTLSWIEKNRRHKPFVDFYFRSPEYNNYPVVGISYAAAKEFCSWLTTQYNQHKKRKYKEVQFRLLNKSEWTYAANKGEDSKVYTWGSGFMQNNRKQYLCNFKHTTFVYDSLTKKYTEFPIEENDVPGQKQAITAPIHSYYPNSFGLFNMCGNVAEMIEDEGLAKGGSYNDPAYAVRISSEKSYIKPTADIGFRVAMKIMDE